MIKTVVHIGRSRGVLPVHTPQQDTILSFSHMFSLKSTHIGGQHPQWLSAPSAGNPGSATGPDMIPIKISDTENPMQLPMKVILLEIALTTFENFKLTKESGCNYYFFQLLTHNDKVRHGLISDFFSCMNEDLVIPLNNEKDKAKWGEINNAYSSGYLAD